MNRHSSSVEINFRIRGCRSATANTNTNVAEHKKTGDANSGKKMTIDKRGGGTKHTKTVMLTIFVIYSNRVSLMTENKNVLIWDFVYCLHSLLSHGIRGFRGNAASLKVQTDVD